MRALLGLAVAAVLATATIAVVRGQTPAPSATGFITGVVQGAAGPEAGVWVIAETKDLPTNFIKIVVTDDHGRFLLPELPNASYSVWVRGYGLVDSTPQPAQAGTTQVTLRVAPAKTPQEAAQVYPGNYWLSMLEPPAASEFPGTGPQGNGLGTEHADAEPLDQLAQVRLQLLPSAGQQADAQRRSRAEGEARAEDARRGVGVATRHRRPRHVDVRRPRQPGTDALAEDVRRLDRARREGRSAASAVAADRHRAQSRADAVGLWATTTRSCTT